MDLLSNAIESIRVGIEDFQDGSRPRLLSSVRNLHSGILLLYKEALLRLSPKNSNDALLMAKIAPSRDSKGSVIFVGEGRNTADTRQIRERFDALGVTTEWALLARVSDVRNDIEHRFPKLDQTALRGLISDSFIIIRNFISTQLQDDPLKLLGEETWQAMLEVSDVYNKEKQECDDALGKIKWNSATLAEGVSELACDSCGSDLLKPHQGNCGETILQCVSCGEKQSPETYVPQAIKSALYSSKYEAIRDGDEVPYVRCPDCGAEAYVMEEQCCAVCEHEAVHTCAMCGTRILAEELGSEPFCSHCAHVMNKND